MKHRLSLVGIGVALATFVVLTPSCGVLEQLNAQEAPRQVVEEAFVVVGVAPVDMGTIENRVLLAGEVFATELVYAHPDTSGVLTRVLVQPGDRVVYDQVLAWVDPSLPGMTYTENPVRAKADGSVLSVPSVPGNRVSPQSVVAEIGNLEDLEIKIPVPERYLEDLVIGMEARIQSRSSSGSSVIGAVSEIAPVVNRISRTIEITVIPRRPHRLRPGQSVEAELLLDSRSDVLLIPSEAVVERRSGFGVFVVRDESAVWEPVELGYKNESQSEVGGSFRVGDLVVIAGQEELTHESPIRVAE